SDRLVVSGRRGDEQASIRLGRLSEAQRRWDGVGHQLTVLRGWRRTVLVLHVVRVAGRIHHEGLDRDELRRRVGGGQQPVGGADPKRLVPVIRAGGRRAGDETIRGGLGGAGVRRQQPAGLADRNLLEPVRQREITDRLGGLGGSEDVA